MSDIDEILNKLERLRESLDEVATLKALTDPEVLVLSQMLDQVLNEYSILLDKQGKKTGRI